MRQINDVLTLGAVAYDAKVVTIWDGFKAWFVGHGLPFDYLLYTTYERQVEGLLRGEHDVSWNSPLAWLQARALAQRAGRTARAIAMRDTDQDLRSVILVRAGDLALRALPDLKGKRVGVGATDSPQATLLPLLHLAEAGVERSDVTVVPHDVLVGKHGDHIGGEREAVRALLAGKVDAACVLDANALAFARDGTTPAGLVRTLETTGPFDHCCFTVLDNAPPGPVSTFTELLLGQRHEDPDVRALMDLEGLKAWRPGRTTGYAMLERATARFGTLDAWLESRR